ncbi:hypothetical protein CJ030_MR6G001823 [Morella rubra]|uniref:Uncharacterized protein n=1 Tax=Morella rubra TaxID=262757 RepID=A0A6A1VD07_9ROSI|nr:hypothetical protein CJ030_MR6G001823 [Morella rubra]
MNSSINVHGKSMTRVVVQARSSVEKSMWPLRDEVQPYDDNFSDIKTVQQEETDDTEDMTIPPDRDDTKITELKKQIACNNGLPQKRGRGPARGTEFDSLRKCGKILIKVKERARMLSDDFTMIYTESVTYIVRTFANLGCRS